MQVRLRDAEQMTAPCVSFVSNVLPSVPDEPAPKDFRSYHMMRQPGTVLVVDDLDDTRELVTELLTRAGYTVLAAADGAEALEAIERALPDLVLSDVMMPNVNGFELCRRLKAVAATRLIPVVLVTALNERQDRLEGITAGADDFLTKPFDSTELLARCASLIRMKRFTDELDSAESVILSLALTVEAREPYTSGHCHRMAAYAAAFGMHLGLANDDVAALHRGGYLHDLGKIAVPDAILSKPGPLTRDEFEVMKTHTVVGESLCGQLRVLRPVRPIVRSHHERLDGSGYPDGLRGNDVPLLAQIMAIVDVYDALTTDRQYRAALSDEIACAELTGDAERGWRSRALVDEFVAICRTGRLKEMAGRIGLQRTAERVLMRAH
jgi:putative two-component system response regulator